MLTALNNDLKPFEDLITKFSREELKPHVEVRDRYPFGDLDDDVIEAGFRKIYDLGFLGIMLPEKYAGIGQGISAMCMMLGHVAEVDASYSLIIFTSAMSQQVILNADADEIAEKIYPKAKDAKEYLVAFPSFTDPGESKELPTASFSGKDYTLTGKLDYLVLGSFSKWAVIPARVAGRQGYSFFLADLNGKGVTKSDPIFSLGLHACPIIDISLSSVSARIIGEEGKGERYFETASKIMHAAAAAINAGIMRGSLKEAVEYTKEREQGGRPVINWSEVRMLLANMAIKSKAAELCVTQTCKAIDENLKDWGRTSIASTLHVHDLACEVVTDGVQLLGGNGYMKDYGQEKRYRDARQVMALLGLAPLKKLALIKEIAG
ncbi:MAG: acyl-CoA dehydrogenase family protein [Desulfomonilia bacterium]|jgi:alkylation response protein AidB-like acyl-CoA dehydrogenase|nr:acyl-CoA dehydrogenase family protein [Deltaproteobacteria bacterium]MDX9762723.1 acyl-CoA dehydrogenase family protein [Desulfomonilia bacterium]HPW68373.1 acyl-CoA dehydrogenase family protein [Deltaproteobacteria bacterium]